MGREVFWITEESVIWNILSAYLLRPPMGKEVHLPEFFPHSPYI
jgi:hypothetical protein